MSWYPYGQNATGGRPPPSSTIADGLEASIRLEGDAYDEANKRIQAQQIVPQAPAK